MVFSRHIARNARKHGGLAKQRLLGKDYKLVIVAPPKPRARVVPVRNPNKRREKAVLINVMPTSARLEMVRGGKEKKEK